MRKHCGGFCCAQPPYADLAEWQQVVDGPPSQAMTIKALPTDRHLRRPDVWPATIVVVHFLQHAVIGAAGIFVVGDIARLRRAGQEDAVIGRFPRRFGPRDAFRRRRAGAQRDGGARKRARHRKRHDGDPVHAAKATPAVHVPRLNTV